MRSIGLYVFVSAYCAAVCIAVLVPVHTEQVLWSIGLVTFALILARVCRTAPGKTVGLALVAIGVAFIRVAFVPHDLPPAFVPLVNTPVSLEGTVVSLPDLRESSQRLVVDVVYTKQHTRVIASVPLYPAIHVGDTIEVRGTLKRPEAFATDGGRTFAYPEFLAKDGIFGVIQPASVGRTGIAPRAWLHFLRSLEVLRTLLSRLLGEALPEPESSLAVGLIVGGKQGLGKELLADFTAAGMLQIVVLSGYNVLIVANALMHVLAGVPKRLRYVLASASIMSFVLLAGSGSSALRAGLMAYVGLSARSFGKRYSLMRAIASSIFLLALWNPLLIPYDPGFQFSFIATLGLALGTPLITPRLLFLKSALLIELLATTLAAEAALLPLLLWQTGNLSLVSVAANVLAMPAVAIAMGMSAGAAILAAPAAVLLPQLPTIIGLPAYLSLYYIISIARHAAALPFATVIVPTFSFWFVVLAYAMLALLVVHCAKRPRLENDALPPTN